MSFNEYPDIHIYKYIYIYIERERERETNRQTEELGQTLYIWHSQRHTYSMGYVGVG